MEKAKLFYTDADGKETHLIAEGEDTTKAAQNAVNEFKKLNLPITNISRIDKLI
jgi:hypothetical protein